MLFLIPIHRLAIYCLINSCLGTAPILCLVKSQKHLLHHLLCRHFHLGIQNLRHQHQERQKAIEPAQNPCTNTDLCACTTAIYPSLLPSSIYGFFMGYSNSTMLMIYFDPKTYRIRRTFNCYIDEYGIKLHPEEFMSLGACMIQ